LKSYRSVIGIYINTHNSGNYLPRHWLLHSTRLCHFRIMVSVWV